MRFKTLLILGLVIWLSLSFESPHQMKVLDFQGLEPHLSKKNDSLYIVNFWATWCKPCVDEIPALEKIAREYQSQKIKLLLVSLDFPSQISRSLEPFIEKNNVRSEVVVLDDPDQNSWITMVHPSWSGALPATLVYDRNSREFYEKSHTYTEIRNIVESKLD